MKKILVFAVSGVFALGIAACGDDEDENGGGGGGGGGGDLSGSIQIDGSSTVGPFAQARGRGVPGARTPTSRSPSARPAPAAASRSSAPARPTSPTPRVRSRTTRRSRSARRTGSTYTEIQVANDGIAVVTNPGVEIECMTIEELKTAWNEGSKVKSFSDINPDFPDTEVSFFGPGTDSGTFDFFTDEINGEEGVSRKDYQPSEDDNVLVQGVAGDEGGFGYFGFSYYEQNQDKLNLVGVDGGDGCVQPSPETIQDGSYKPLSRPLYMYVSQQGREAARGGGVPRLRGREPGHDRRDGPDRPAHGRAGHEGTGHHRHGDGVVGTQPDAWKQEPQRQRARRPPWASRAAATART